MSNIHLPISRIAKDMPHFSYEFHQHLDELRSFQEMPYLTTFHQHLDELGQVHVHRIGSSHLNN
jgi:hypothetical protein